VLPLWNASSRDDSPAKGFPPSLRSRNCSRRHRCRPGRDQDPLPLSDEDHIEALKAPVVARFASFLGQPPIRATLTWTLPDRRIMITGKRGDEPFEEVIS
jgi:hypothetical protein